MAESLAGRETEGEPVVILLAVAEMGMVKEARAGTNPVAGDSGTAKEVGLVALAGCC